MVRKKHNWVTFGNPRNGKVRLRACERCGMVEDRVSIAMVCEVVSDAQHGMKKMGWKIVDKAA